MRSPDVPLTEALRATTVRVGVLFPKMPTIGENKETWDITYDWPQAGDEWSATWGSPVAQWQGCLLPRIFPFLRGRILEIAPGRGRWTQFLRTHCSSLVGIDLAPSCIAHCQDRFKGDANLEFRANDGLLLPMVEDASIDFVFSFDSLVHVEADAISSYVGELARVLKPGRAAFIHHSNYGGHSAFLMGQGETPAVQNSFSSSLARIFHERGEDAAIRRTLWHVVCATGTRSMGRRRLAGTD